MAQSLLPRFTVTLTSETVYGEPLNLQACAAALAQFSLESVVGRIALLKHINESIICDPDARPDDRDRHIALSLAFLFPPEERKLIAREIGKEPNFRPCSDQALLAVLKLAAMCCARDDDHFIHTDGQLSVLGHVLLSFQSALFTSSFTDHLRQRKDLEQLSSEHLGQFVRNTLAHRTGLDTRSALARLYAFCCIPEVGELVLERTKRSVADWFQETFGMESGDYHGCAVLAAAPSLRLDLDGPDAKDLFYHENTLWNQLTPEAQARIKGLLNLAAFPVTLNTAVPEGTLADFLFDATDFHVRPVLDIFGFSLCVSGNLLMRKFMLGLPYLAQEALLRKKGQPLTKSEIKASRAPFGHLLEGYVGWLLERLFWPDKSVEVIRECRFGRDGECDIVIVAGDIALTIEVKATVPTLEARRTGIFESLDSMVEAGATQTFGAAHAVRGGEARRLDGTAIEGIRFVLPCVVTYDDVPLFHPISEFYEKHLARKTDLPLFTAANGVEPVQFFDVDFIESWERRVDLSPGSRGVFGYLLQRARRPDLRYRRIVDGVGRPAAAGAPQPFDEIAKASREFSERVRQWLVPTPPSATSS